MEHARAAAASIREESVGVVQDSQSHLLRSHLFVLVKSTKRRDRPAVSGDESSKTSATGSSSKSVVSKSIALEPDPVYGDFLADFLPLDESADEGGGEGGEGEAVSYQLQPVGTPMACVTAVAWDFSTGCFAILTGSRVNIMR